jgi:hypothetical protein
MIRLTPPRKIVFWISVVIAILGLVAFFVPALKEFAVFIALVAYVLLALGNILKGF